MCKPVFGGDVKNTSLLTDDAFGFFFAKHSYLRYVFSLKCYQLFIKNGCNLTFIAYLLNLSAVTNLFQPFLNPIRFLASLTNSIALSL